MTEAQTNAETLQSALNDLRVGNGTLNAQADAMLSAAFQSAEAQLAALGLTLPELTAENFAEALDAAAQGMDEAAAQIAALKNQMEQTVRFVDDLKTYTESAAQAAESAEAMSASMTRRQASKKRDFQGKVHRRHFREAACFPGPAIRAAGSCPRPRSVRPDQESGAKQRL